MKTAIAKNRLLALLLLLPAAAAAEGGPTWRDLRSQALGNTGVASSSGTTALFLNPAGLARGEGGGAGLSLDLGINSVLVDYADWAAKNYAYMDDMDSLLARIGPVDAKWAPFSQGSVLHGRVRDVAVALVSDSRYDLAVTEAVVTPVLGVGVLSDLVVTAGKGMEGPGGWRYGVALKYLYRVRFDRRLIGTTDEEFYEVNDLLRKPDDGAAGKLGKVKAAAEIAGVSQGAGANLGVEKDFAEFWTGAISLLDLPTVIGSRLARPDLHLGLAWRRDLDLLPDLEDRVLVNLDWQRFLMPGTPWFRQLKAGAALDLGLGRRSVGFLALGLNDGYPTFGVRFGYVAYLSYVYTAQETGTYPGQQKLSFHKLSLQLEI